MSFRLRVLLLIVVLVATSSAATAWLTLRQASSDLTASVAASRQDVTLASNRLADYGHLHGGWTGVDSLIRDLAASLGQRVRVTTADGAVVADSDPSRPAPTLSSIVDARPALDLRLVTDAYSEFRMMLGAVDTYERDQAYAACLARAGVSAKSVPGKGFPLAQPIEATGGCQFPRIGTPLDPAVADAGKRCLGAADPPACISGVFTGAIARFAPPPLRLFIGVRDEPAYHLSSGSIAVAAGAVVLVAVLCAFLLSRRVLRPIGALTEASRRLADTRLIPSVPESGRDELAELARAFNRMAASLALSEQRQRRLVGDIAHELRTPLANLRGYLEALSDGVLRPSPELFASLHEEALLQQRIVDDLQELALAEAGVLAYHRGVVDLAELTETVRTAFHPQAVAAGVSVTVDASPAVVSGDSDRLRQVLGNLVRNALAATPSGGSIALAVQSAGTQAVVTVTDSGRGIAAADLPHVFDRFWRADAARARSTGGSGLGLAIAHEIVAAHDGTLGIESEAGRGTTVTITLPTMAASS